MAALPPAERHDHERGARTQPPARQREQEGRPRAVQRLPRIRLTRQLLPPHDASEHNRRVRHPDGTVVQLQTRR